MAKRGERMANTVRAENGSEIYKDKIYQLSDEYIQMELSIDPDEIKIPENKKIMKYETEHYSNNICIA